MRISEGLSCSDLGGGVPFQTLPDLGLLWPDSESREGLFPQYLVRSAPAL